MSPNLRAVMQPRIYTYKITFEEVPYYYYGSKKEKRYNEGYWGSPTTNKWCWELYTPKKQILELFDFTDEGYEECRKVEDRLIKPVLNDKLCLNERCGGNYSLKIKRQNGINVKNNKKGIHSFDEKQRKENAKNGRKYLQQESLSKGGKAASKINKNNKVGIYGLSKEKRIEICSKGGKIAGKKLYDEGKGLFGMNEEDMKSAQIEGGRKQGNICKHLKKGICGLTKEERSENTKKQMKQKWKCLVTGHISTYNSLSRFQNNRDIDKSMREMIQ
jgi:hypothetical protein